MQLNLDKIFKLENDSQIIIFTLFNELVNSLNVDSGKGITIPSGLKVDPIRCNIIYNTLTENEYLITRRDINLNKIL